MKELGKLRGMVLFGVVKALDSILSTEKQRQEGRGEGGREGKIGKEGRI